MKISLFHKKVLEKKLTTSFDLIPLDKITSIEFNYVTREMLWDNNDKLTYGKELAWTFNTWYSIRWRFENGDFSPKTLTTVNAALPVNPFAAFGTVLCCALMEDTIEYSLLYGGNYSLRDFVPFIKYTNEYIVGYWPEYGSQSYPLLPLRNRRSPGALHFYAFPDILLFRYFYHSEPFEDYGETFVTQISNHEICIITDSTGKEIGVTGWIRTPQELLPKDDRRNIPADLH